MLTKSDGKNREFRRTLYFEFSRIIVISMVISLALVFIYSFLIDYIIENDYLNNEVTVRAEINGIIDSLDQQTDINTVIDIINAQLPRYEVVYHNFSEENVIYTVGNDFNQDVYALYTTIDDRALVLLVSDTQINTLKTLYRGLGVLLGMACFITLLRKLGQKSINYLDDINSGIRRISKGDYDVSIDLVGDNEITELVRAINSMARDIKEQNLEKEEIEKKQRQLITNVSHDLKTPLTSIIGYIDIVVTLLDKQVDPAIIMYLERALAKSKQQQELISKLFEYSKIINSDISINRREIDLNLFVRQYTELIDYDVELLGFDSKYMIMADPDLLQRVFDNIFSNIGKYGIDDEKVIISLDNLGDEVRLSVENKTEVDLTGKTAMMFDRTYVEEASRTRQSSGIGLSIVKEALAAMGADIHAEFNKPYLAMIMVFRKHRLKEDH